MEPDAYPMPPPDPVETRMAKDKHRRSNPTQQKPWWRRHWILTTLLLVVLLFSAVVLFGNYLIAKDKKKVDRWCQDEASSYAKYPGGVEFPEPIRPAHIISPEAASKSTGAPLDPNYRSY